LSAHSEADAAYRAGPAAFQAAIVRARVRRDRDLGEALFSYARERDASGQSGAVSALASGCRGAVAWRQHTFIALGIVLAKQRVTVSGWCYRSPRITRDDGHFVTRYAAVAYCWKDTSHGSYWKYRNAPGHPDVKKAFAQGTLGLNWGPAGCVSVRSDRPIATYRGDGSWG
jgi:hypothetical protein